MSVIRHLCCWIDIAKTKGVDIMENTQNRNDALKFFESMTEKEQQVAIRYLRKIIKKPPDCDSRELQEVAEHEQITA